MSRRRCVYGGGVLSGSGFPLLQHKIILPRLPSSGLPVPGPSDRSGAPGRSPPSEYHSNRVPNLQELAHYLPREANEVLQRRAQLDQFASGTEKKIEEAWYYSQSHLRKQQQLTEDMGGAEAAVKEWLQPSKPSFRSELRQRPLDKQILEEVYKGLHGKRIERKLKKGVTWEHWITKGDGTAPVFNTSKKTQQTFAYGGHIHMLAGAYHPKQFPRPLYTRLTGAGQAAAPCSPSPGVAGDDSDVATAGVAPSVAVRQIGVPEVAFIGRTCSGKSSLINAIVNAMVAPYGHLQGTTTAVNFYSVNNRIVLVDCPGYGHYHPMQTPKLDAENAVATMDAYLERAAPKQRSSGAEVEVPGASEAHRTKGRATPPRNVKRVFVCVTARGLQHSDLAYLDRLEKLSIPFSVVFTKTDEAPIRFLARLADYTRSQLVGYRHCQELMLTSSLRLAGIDKMQQLIASVALDSNEPPLNGATMNFDAIV